MGLEAFAEVNFIVGVAVDGVLALVILHSDLEDLLLSNNKYNP